MIQERAKQRGSNCTLVDIEEMKKAAMETPSDPPLPNLIPDDLSSSNSDCESEDNLNESRKRVTFKSSLKMRKIASHRKYTKEERAATWYSPAEYKQLRDQATRTAKKMARGSSVDTLKETSRGLEHRSADAHKIRQTKRLDIIWTVLGEQDEMYENGEDVDHDKIAEIYSMCTKDCVAEARIRGLEDELAVRDNNKPPTKPASAKHSPKPAPNHPVFNNHRKADDIMNLVASLSMKATMTIRRWSLQWC